MPCYQPKRVVTSARKGEQEKNISNNLIQADSFMLMLRTKLLSTLGAIGNALMGRALSRVN